MRKRIAIDLGGTKTEIILTEDNPLQVLRRKRVPTQQEQGYDFILHQLADLIWEYKQECVELPKIGLGIPGSMSPRTGLVRNANTQCLIGQSLKKDLEQLVKQPVAIENDANCFTLSEALLGAGQGYDVVLGIIMGTGMGGGICLSGQLWRGSQGNAGEWGHASINFEGPQCWCGQRGCMELYLSGPAVEKHYYQLTKNKKSLKEINRDYENKTDLAAKKSIERLLVYFGRAMANLIASFDPHAIVIGGGLSNIPSLYTRGFEQTARQAFVDGLSTPILPNKLGDSSGIYGAALIAE